MSNIFSERKGYVQRPKRNVFDLSFQNNLTMEFGKLYPVFCKEVVPGDSFRIKPTFALRLLPLVFPVQTRMQANLHFFYVRNRNLWKDWTKFIGHTQSGLTPPYLGASASALSTRSLGDYLGIPTTLYGSYGLTSDSAVPRGCLLGQSHDDYFDVVPYLFKTSTLDDVSINSVFSTHFGTDYINSSGQRPVVIPLLPWTGTDNSAFFKPLGSTISLTCQGNAFANTDNLKFDIVVASYDASSETYKVVEKIQNCTGSLSGSTCSIVLETGTVFDTAKKGSQSVVDYLNSVLSSNSDGVTSYNYRLAIIGYSDGPLGVSTRSGFATYGSYTPSTGVYAALDGYLTGVKVGITSVNVSDISDPALTSVNPYVNDIHVSALPFRAYESIYNAFYRNEQNDPLIIDGNPEYDVYCPNRDGGVDNFDYQLHYRNWEPDFLTSAVQSPQQGVAPLVGVSSTGNFKFAGKDSDGNVTYFNATAIYGDDGNSITGFKLSDDTTLSPDDLQTPNASADVTLEKQKQATIYNLNQMALTGISINDFRNVNALQRWLETNIRRGYKYREQLKSHFGVDVRYDELDMPEFIGGMSEPIYINQINATTANGDQPLGDYAGQGSVMATANHSVEQYCDEHGFIIGILSISPVPNYSQVLPKMFLKQNYLDYYFPEFGHIGMQPIDYREVAPIQTSSAGGDLMKTFGYQRPWYDYIASIDEVHGLFRTNLRNFLCNRVFDTPPVLNHDFLKVDPNQLNSIFTDTTSQTDKILGQIWFDVTAKRPVPRMGIPRLE